VGGEITEKQPIIQMKTTALFLAAIACCCPAVFAQPASQTATGSQPGVDMHPGYDHDGDGTLSDKEKTAMEKEMKSMAAMREKRMIKKYDKDGDGKLSAEEKSTMEKDESTWEKSHHDKMMGKWDKDKDGKLSDEEKTAMRKKKAADRKELLGKYDSNKDGVLDDSEWETAGKSNDSMIDEVIESGPRSKR
jgi:Ca2+-binding EF-hand superfamily protein